MNRPLVLALLFGAFASSCLAAQPDIVIHGDGPNAESLTSTADGAVIFGSMAKAEVFRSAKGATSAEVWLKPGTAGLQRILGVYADQRSGVLWVCSSGTPDRPQDVRSAVRRSQSELRLPRRHGNL